MTLKIAQSAEPEDEGYWKWSVWLDGSAGELDSVKQVVWRLHPTFPEPIQRVAKRETNFRLDTSGWGEFEIYADVHLKRGKLQHLQHWIRLEQTEGAPARKRKKSSASAAPPPTVYLSYSRRNAELARHVAEALRKKKVDVIVDIDIPSGVDWRRWSTEKILESDALVMLIGDDSSAWQEIEVSTALSGGAILIPITFHGQNVTLPNLKKIQQIQVKEAGLSAASEIAKRVLQRLTD